MKKTLFILMISLFTLSCEDEPEQLQWKIIDLAVAQNDWVYNQDDDKLNGFFSCHFDRPEITPFVYNSGTVVTYTVLGNSQQTLPYVRHYENALGNLWTQTVDYSFSKGGLDIYVTNSDFYNVDNPESMKFRVVLMY